jgi:hypothetical protein
VGLAASLSIRPRRYACKDWPASAGVSAGYPYTTSVDMN